MINCSFMGGNVLDYFLARAMFGFKVRIRVRYRLSIGKGLITMKILQRRNQFLHEIAFVFLPAPPLHIFEP